MGMPSWELWECRLCALQVAFDGVALTCTSTVPQIRLKEGNLSNPCAPLDYGTPVPVVRLPQHFTSRMALIVRQLSLTVVANWNVLATQILIQAQFQPRVGRAAVKKAPFLMMTRMITSCSTP